MIKKKKYRYASHRGWITVVGGKLGRHDINI